MREMTVGQDADFSVERFESRYKTDLGNDLQLSKQHMKAVEGGYFKSP